VICEASGSWPSPKVDRKPPYSLEHALDAGVTALGQHRRVHAVARRKAVVHALAHGLVLRRHQAGRLGAGQAERVFEASSVQAQQLAHGRRGRMGAEHRARMPAARQHLHAVQRHADARADLVAGHRRFEKPLAADRRGAALAHRPQCGQHDRCAVQRAERMKIVELEALDEGAVEQRRAGRTRIRAPADDGAIAGALEFAHDADCRARPRQLRADDGAGDAVERQQAGALASGARCVIELEAGEPVAQLAGRASGVSGGAGGRGSTGHVMVL